MFCACWVGTQNYVCVNLHEWILAAWEQTEWSSQMRCDLNPAIGENVLVLIWLCNTQNWDQGQQLHRDKTERAWGPGYDIGPVYVFNVGHIYRSPVWQRRTNIHTHISIYGSFRNKDNMLHSTQDGGHRADCDFKPRSSSFQCAALVR